MATQLVRALATAVTAFVLAMWTALTTRVADYLDTSSLHLQAVYQLLMYKVGRVANAAEVWASSGGPAEAVRAAGVLSTTLFDLSLTAALDTYTHIDDRVHNGAISAILMVGLMCMGTAIFIAVLKQGVQLVNAIAKHTAQCLGLVAYFNFVALPWYLIASLSTCVQWLATTLALAGASATRAVLVAVGRPFITAHGYVEGTGGDRYKNLVPPRNAWMSVLTLIMVAARRIATDQHLQLA
ncbi:hypothetical protein LTR12_011001 [Friedmanniomyces endolithicus]|nr:hypothetical protein LTR12_011001 [Friedmanniomyces endolithicus]